MEHLKEFSENSRVWIYQSNRIMTQTELKKIDEVLSHFNQEWLTHGSQMKSSCFTIAPCFIIIAVDQSIIEASGCSIDSSVRMLKEIEQNFDLDLFDRLSLSFQNLEGEIEIIKMAEFQKGLKEGIFNEDTIVFNNLISNLIELRNNWKVPVKESWHKNLI